jgi:hypothetical protein
MPAYEANISFLLPSARSWTALLLRALPGPVRSSVIVHTISPPRRRPRPFRWPGCINTRNGTGDQRDSELAAVPGEARAQTEQAVAYAASRCTSRRVTAIPATAQWRRCSWRI